MAGYGSRVVPPDLVIGVDVGGTKMLAGVVARDGSVGRTIERPTSTAGQASLLEELDGLVAGPASPTGSSAIGVGVPMNLDRRTGIGFGAVNLPLRSLDLAAHLRGRFSIPVGVENDGNAIALAEWRVGAGQGCERPRRARARNRRGRGRRRSTDGSIAAGPSSVTSSSRPTGRPARGAAMATGISRPSRPARRRSARPSSCGETVPTPIGSYVKRRPATRPRVRRSRRSGTTSASRSAPSRTSSPPTSWSWEAASARRRGSSSAGPAEEAARREALHPADDELRIVQAALGDDAGLVGAGLVGFEALDGLR